MDVSAKLTILADAAKYDASCASSGAKGRRGSGPGLGSTQSMGICHSYTPDGRCVSLLKILLTNYCIYDCQYCVNRISSETPRARFTVEEVVRLTIEFYKRNYIEGLFLSSGIIQSSDYTMEQLIGVAQTLRERERFRGYIHLKTIPGAAPELVERAGLFADRLSVNVELPTARDLQELAPEKKPEQITGSMGAIRSHVEDSQAQRKAGFRAPLYAPAGQSTQMIVGATPTPDREIILAASTLYDDYKLKRVYFSAFSPIPHADSRLPAQAPPLVREHRLYQADWLVRFYGFQAEEILPADQPNLDLEKDPKLAWALRHREQFPVDLNRAPREQLLRVPGMGTKSVQKLLEMRKFQSVRLADLTRLRVAMRRALPFVVTADHNPATRWLDRPRGLEVVTSAPKQLTLFDAASTAANGEL